jgi:predicted nucleotidyltransferase component of viral defense system
LSLLKKVTELPQIPEFYLAGGSAAALYLGHRVSVDLDFFTERESYQSEPLIQSIQRVGNLKIQQQSRGTLVGLLDNVQISFFTYPYALLEVPGSLEGIRIASLLDISLMKIIAISQRGKMRDFVDLFFLCQEKFTLIDLLNFIPRKYPAITYASYQLLRSLVYFTDAEEDVPPRPLIDWEWNEIKEFFRNEVKVIMQQMV